MRGRIVIEVEVSEQDIDLLTENKHYVVRQLENAWRSSALHITSIDVSLLGNGT